MWKDIGSQAETRAAAAGGIGPKQVAIKILAIVTTFINHVDGKAINFDDSDGRRRPWAEKFQGSPLKVLVTAFFFLVAAFFVSRPRGQHVHGLQ